MLSDSIMAFGVFFLLLMIIIGMVLCMGMVFFAFNVQAEAQSIAVSEGRMGYFTTDEATAVDQYVSNYCTQHGANASDATVTTSNSDSSNPAIYGTNVTASLTMPYRFQLGSFVGFTIPITGNGRSISAYVPALQ